VIANALIAEQYSKTNIADEGTMGVRRSALQMALTGSNDSLMEHSPNSHLKNSKDRDSIGVSPKEDRSLMGFTMDGVNANNDAYGSSASGDKIKTQNKGNNNCGSNKGKGLGKDKRSSIFDTHKSTYERHGDVSPVSRAKPKGAHKESTWNSKNKNPLTITESLYVFGIYWLLIIDY